MKSGNGVEYRVTLDVRLEHVQGVEPDWDQVAQKLRSQMAYDPKVMRIRVEDNKWASVIIRAVEIDEAPEP